MTPRVPVPAVRRADREETGGHRIAVPSTTNEHRVNDRIRSREVRLVDPDGNQLGIKALAEALTLARRLSLDLVEVAPQASPPVCRIMDYGKFKFDAAQRAKESRRKTTGVGLKEMKYRPKIGVGDFDTKTRQVAKFLEEGHKVKITIMFRGREVFHPELGKKILDRIADQMAGSGKSESDPRLDGRNMVMVLAPDKRAKQSAASRGPRADQGPVGQDVAGGAGALREDGPGGTEADVPADAEIKVEPVTDAVPVDGGGTGAGAAGTADVAVPAGEPAPGAAQSEGD